MLHACGSLQLKIALGNYFVRKVWEIFEYDWSREGSLILYRVAAESQLLLTSEYGALIFERIDSIVIVFAKAQSLVMSMEEVCLDPPV